MGAGPETSVIGSDHRAWRIPNLFICDGSVMPTQGSANPALTIMALASRLGELLAAKRITRPARSRAASAPPAEARNGAATTTTSGIRSA